MCVCVCVNTFAISFMCSIKSVTIFSLIRTHGNNTE